MTDKELVLGSSIDQYMSELPIGSIAKAMGNNLRGINFRQILSPLPRQTDSKGYVFFTRPQLNMDTYNLTNHRGFYSLLTNNRLSYQRYTRMMLDPRLGLKDAFTCPFVDNHIPFIPILTNNLVSLSGWPDITAPTYTSDSGVYGEEHSIVDGVSNQYEAFDVDATFMNTRGNPLIYLFYAWVKYEMLVFEGILNPYLDMITENEVDYNTRIYRLVMDKQNKYVTFIACTGASFPINVPLGNLFDYNVDNPFNRNAEINIRFRCLGFRFEDVVKYEFNKAMGAFNQDFEDLLENDLNSPDSAVARDNSSVAYRFGKYVKVPHELAAVIDSSASGLGFYSINYKAYPYINLLTNELEWWVKDTDFTKAAEEEFKSSSEKVAGPQDEFGE